MILGHWVAAWAASQQLASQGDLPTVDHDTSFRGITIRQTVRLSSGGDILRLRISNLFGKSDLDIASVTVGFPKRNETWDGAGSNFMLAHTAERLTFSGSLSAVVPGGKSIVSDQFRFKGQSTEVVIVNLFLERGHPANAITYHSTSRTDTWISHGDRTLDERLDQSTAQHVPHWFFIEGIDIWQTSGAHSVVAFGDSLTDGRGSITNGNNRWPDLLVNRLKKLGLANKISVVNEGIGGDLVLHYGLAESLLKRLDRDVLQVPGVKTVILWGGVNDIGTTPTDQASQEALKNKLIEAFKTIAARCHASGLKILASTITPFNEPGGVVRGFSHPNRERTRKQINDWLRSCKNFDGIVDNDAVVRDSKETSVLLREYNYGDNLHLNPSGYQAIADKFPLELLKL